jgi:Arylsulfatase regulator (Fe-S oxidoreductase)
MQLNRISLLHPSIAKLIDLDYKNNCYPKFEIELSQDYYIKKLNYLKKYKWIGNNNNQVSFIDLNAKDVKLELANISQVIFEVTDSCNLKCKYCGYGDLYNNYDIRQNRKLDPEKAVKLLDYLNNLWNSEDNKSYKKKVHISFYGGEPLLNMIFIKKIISYVEGLNNKNREFVFSMTSNALLLDQHMDYIVNKNFELLISLDGNSNNTIYRVDKQNKPVFDSLIKNIDLLRNKYPDYFHKNVNFNAVLHDKNSVNEIIDFIKNRYSKIPTIGELNTSGIKEEKKETFWKMYKNKKKDILESYDSEKVLEEMFVESTDYRNLVLFLYTYSGYIYKNYNDLFQIKKKEKEEFIPTGTCIPFSRKLFITAYGKIFPCERIGHKYSLGNITDNSINLDYEDIKNKYNSFYKKVKHQCKFCYLYRTCPTCIFNINSQENNNSYCTDFTNERSFKKYLSEQMSFLENHSFKYKYIMNNILVK